MRISVKLSVGVIASLAMLIGTAVDTSAQGRRDAVKIDVLMHEDSCKYVIKAVTEDRLPGPEQNRFLMNAGGFLEINAVGTAARVRIEDDRVKNVRGYRNRGVLRLIAGESDFLHVRPRRTQDPGSLHKVSINCCSGFNSRDECENPLSSDSLMMSSVLLEGAQINRAGLGTLDRAFDWLFGDEEPPAGPPLPGGPEMDVHP